MTLFLDEYLKPLGINQIIGKEEIIGPGNNEVVVATANGTRHLSYDYLILAAGSSLKAVNLPGNWAKVLPFGLNYPKA